VQFGEGSGKKTPIPLISLPQFLGPAIGLDTETLGISLNRIGPEKILATLVRSR
jgi:heterodisulfide reductase subunit B